MIEFIMNIARAFEKINNSIKEKNFNQAKLVVEKILKKNPQNFQALSYQSFILINLRDFNGAKNTLAYALSFKFDKDLAINYANLLMDMNLINEAKLINNKVLNIDENHLIARFNNARIHAKIGDKEKAFKEYEYVIQINPEFVNTYISYGYNLNLNKDYAKAIEVYLRGLKYDTKNLSLLYNLGVTYNNYQKYNLAINYLEEYLKIKPIDENAILTITVSYLKSNQIEKAKLALKKLEKINPKNKILNFQLGTIEMQSENFNLAIQLFSKSINRNEHAVEAHFHIGLVYLKQSKYHLVDNEYRYRVKRDGEKRYGMFDDFEKKELSIEEDLLVGREQGIGDEILMCRLLVFLKNRVKSITYITDDRLKKILEKNIPQITVISLTNYLKNEKHFDNHIKINLGTIFRYLNPNEFFSLIYLWTPTINLESKYISQISKEKIKIGLSWKSKNDTLGKHKSLELSELYKSLLNVDNLEFINLQYGDTKDEIEQINQHNILKIKDVGIDLYNDLERLFALIDLCDIIITTSNITAHISGALGKKTLLLLPKRNGRIWYWYSNSSMPKWYKSIKIINQEEDLDWDSALRSIKGELELLIKNTIS